MSDADVGRHDRPALPRDAFRAKRSGAGSASGPSPVVVTPDYEDRVGSPADVRRDAISSRQEERALGPKKRPRNARNPLEPYGERSSSRPYALRLPEAIDLALRRIAAEERTHPLRIVDRLIYDHLKRVDRLPPLDGG